MKTPRSKTQQSVNPEDVEVRRRILSAALSAFMEAGYAQLREPVRFAEPFLFGINQQGRTGHPRGRQRIDKRRAEVFGGIGTCRRINTLLT